MLTEIRKNTNLKIDPATGKKVHTITAYHQKKLKEFRKWDKAEGWQLRYIYFIDPKAKENLTVPIVPFSKIDEMGAGMYKGEKITQSERHIDKQK